MPAQGAEAAGVLLAHTGSGPYVRQTVEALSEHGLLDRFATTWVSSPTSAWQRGACRLGRAIGVDLSAQLARRPAPAIGSRKIATHAGREMLRTVSSRLDRRGVVTDALWDWMTKDFDRWSSRLIDANTRAVYGYEYNCLALFERAAQLGLPRILEAPCAEHEFVSTLQERELNRFPQLRTDYSRRAQDLRSVRTARRRAEFAAATLVIANSSFTVDSYRQSGLATDRFRVVPLGAPPVAAADDRPPMSGPARMIWAGNFSVLKGAHILLEALAGITGATGLTLDVYGKVELPARLLESAPPWIRFHGVVSQSELFARFAEADFLTMPSLSDGFGQVVAEALAHGLPVVTTPMVGASALIRDTENGRLVTASDADVLAKAIQWMLDQRSRWPEMREASRRAAAGWQWSDYRRELARVVSEHLGHA